MGTLRPPFEQVVDEVEQTRVGVVEVLEDHDHRGGGREPFEERAPGGQELLRAGGRDLDPGQGEQRRLDLAPLVCVGYMLGDRRADLRSGRRRIVGLEQAGSAPNHFAQCPEADAVAVGGASTRMPPDRVHQPVDVLQELPGETGLADAGRADDRYQAGAFLAGRGMEELLEQPQLIVAADEWRLERLGAVAPADPGDDPDGAPGWNRRGLAFERLLARFLEGDRLAGRTVGRLADQHGTRRGDRLQAASGVDEITGDHALVICAERDGGFAGQDASAGLDGRAEGLDRVDQLEGGADRAFGIVLVGGGGAPDGHDRIADELLDDAPVACHDVLGEIEVPAEEFPGVLGVAALGERGEPDEVGEQDRDEPALSDGWGGRRTDAKAGRSR
jgi:hypothetical protein